MELTAAHQYQLHACVLDEWGMGLLATKMREEMQEELGHSEQFLVRLLFLKGQPKIELAKPPVRAQTLKEMFETDTKDKQMPSSSTRKRLFRRWKKATLVHVNCSNASRWKKSST